MEWILNFKKNIIEKILWYLTVVVLVSMQGVQNEGPYF